MRDNLYLRMSHRELRDSGVMSDDLVEGDVDITSIEEFRVAESSRYMFCSQTYQMGHGNVLLSTELELVRMLESDQRWLNDAEFLQKYRMSCSSLNIFASKIENYPVFHTNMAKPQTAPKYQLACFLLYIGLYGSGVLKGQSWTFNISYMELIKYQKQSKIRTRTYGIS